VAAEADQSDAAWNVPGSSPGEASVRRTVEDLCEAAAVGQIEVVFDRTLALRNAWKALDYAETGRPLGRVIMTA
jgi:NADPH:quinone reductase-like Zn-dependent oxidoreductase